VQGGRKGPTVGRGQTTPVELPLFGSDLVNRQSEAEPIKTSRDRGRATRGRAK